jgi:hypothetical protein
MLLDSAPAHHGKHSGADAPGSDAGEAKTPGAVKRRAFQVKRITTTNSYTSDADYIPVLAAAVGLPGDGPPMRNV